MVGPITRLSVEMTPVEALDYCRTLLAHFTDRLSEWEDTFVRDVKLRLDADAPLTPRQAEVLDRIMDRCAQQHGRHLDED